MEHRSVCVLTMDVMVRQRQLGNCLETSRWCKLSNDTQENEVGERYKNLIANMTRRMPT